MNICRLTVDRKNKLIWSLTTCCIKEYSFPGWFFLISILTASASSFNETDQNLSVTSLLQRKMSSPLGRINYVWMNALLDICSYTVRITPSYLRIFSFQLIGHSMVLIILEKQQACCNQNRKRSYCVTRIPPGYGLDLFSHTETEEREEGVFF